MVKNKILILAAIVVFILVIVGLYLIFWKDKFQPKDKEGSDEEIFTKEPMENLTAEVNTSSHTDNKLINWTKENGIRVSGISSCTIIEDNEYWMYYTGRGIKLAISDDGLNFEDKGIVIGEGNVGSGQEMVSNPVVIKLKDGRYRMIYEGSDWGNDEKGGHYQTNRKLYSAISNDGKKWVKEEGARFFDYGDGKPGEIFTSVPDIIQLSNGTLRMYYTRGITSASALSNDEGLTWIKETNLNLNRKVAIDIDVVLLEDETYKLFFTTFADEFGIGEQWVMGANSYDGTNFKINEKKLIEPSTLGGLITDPDVIKINNGYRMYYGEFKKGENEPNIMSAFSSG